MKWLRRIAAAVVFISVAIAIAAAWLDRHRPGLGAYAAHRYDVPPAPGRLTVTWLGTTALLISDGNDALLLDPFFTRPEGWWRMLGNRAIAPDKEKVRSGLSHLGGARLRAVGISHSHYDHAMDAGIVARLTGAPLLGSSSTANIGLGAGLGPAQTRVVQSGRPMTHGPFEVTFIESAHAGATGGAPTGTIDAPLVPPARYSDYRLGGTFSILVRHRFGSLLHHGSAGFEPGALSNVRADGVFLGVALVDDLEAYLSEVVDAVDAAWVIPVHWDDFTRSAGRPLQSSPIGVNLPDFFRGVRQHRPNLLVHTLEYGRAVTLPPGR